ncbi:MAG: ABC-type transport auxiliary lipoprotein family protein [Woeseiaceae bacterium]|nr:ABC-type transport auxiliary lipoprotein family protein [Woeseiaceae bacterium]
MKTPVALLLAGASLLTGCVLPGPGNGGQPQRTYTLQAPAAAGEAERRWPCVTLRIARPDAAPGFSTARMAYTDTAHRLDYFAYNAWVAMPPAMVAAATETYLAASGRFGAVISGSADVRSDYRLDAGGIRLVQRVDGQASSVIFESRVRVVDVESRRLLASRAFRYEEPAAAANPEAGVAAANRAFARYLDDLAAFLDTAFAPQACPG